METKKYRFTAMLLCIALLLAGCSPLVPEKSENKTIYTTFYPLYALTRMIVGDVEGIELHCLIQPQDVCLRSYTLSDWDLYILGYAADLLVSAGNGLEAFDDQLEKIGETIPVAEVLYGLDMQNFESDPDEESHFSGNNPYLYMSTERASAILENIFTSLMILDPDHTAQYEQNYKEAQAELNELQEYVKATTSVCSGTLCAVMHESLFYTATDCNLNISAWHERESGEMLYGNELKQCIDTFQKKSVKLVLIESYAPKALVDILEQVGFTVVKLDVLTTRSESDGVSGYLDALKNNAALIAEACSRQ